MKNSCSAVRTTIAELPVKLVRYRMFGSDVMTSASSPREASSLLTMWWRRLRARTWRARHGWRRASARAPRSRGAPAIGSRSLVRPASSADRRRPLIGRGNDRLRRRSAASEATVRHRLRCRERLPIVQGPSCAIATIELPARPAVRRRPAPRRRRRLSAGGGGSTFCSNSSRICSNDRPSAEAGGGGGSTFRASSSTVRCRSGSLRASARAARYCVSASVKRSLPMMDFGDAANRGEVFRRALAERVRARRAPSSRSLSSISARPSVTPSREVTGMKFEAGAADVDRFLKVAGAPALLGELREGDRRRVLWTRRRRSSIRWLSAIGYGNGDACSLSCPIRPRLSVTARCTNTCYAPE